MMIARWSIDAKFGYKEDAIALLKRWMEEVAPQVGLEAGKMRLLTGSVGALEATLVAEHLVADLAELDAVWAKLASLDAHRRWGKELEPLVVSGTSKWEIYRLLG
ncbi:hypothetical protein PVT67_16815 [Gallaecimonas kandeliae]|uniref:hypothetical protein n=1 Tax=Gallaecimonas kandeliae TaxID=3029055 RepID=UPI002649E847|nr:hypothetical protein [Gallaecimonas kandeliae]WKE65305.1 hypothetical protein PVT67_16815 [Gallaecimonas kandeliae]